MKTYQILGAIALGVLGGFPIGFGLYTSLVKHSEENKPIPLDGGVTWEIKQKAEEEVRQALQKEREEVLYKEWKTKRENLPEGYRDDGNIFWGWIFRNQDGQVSFDIGLKNDGTVVWRRKRN